jgi:hypothetical protein
MRFLPFFFRTTQRKRGNGRPRATPLRPLLEASGGGGRDKPSRELWLGCGQPLLQAGEREGENKPAMAQAVDRLWPGGRDRPHGQTTSGELWSGRDGKKAQAGSSGWTGNEKKRPAAGEYVAGDVTDEGLVRSGTSRRSFFFKSTCGPES